MLRISNTGTITSSRTQQSWAQYQEPYQASSGEPSTSFQHEEEEDVFDEAINQPPPSQPEFLPPVHELRVDDFKTEYHPHTDKKDLIQHFEDFQRESFSVDPASLDDQLW